MVQNYILMFSVPASTAFLKLQYNWATKIIHWFRIRTRWRDKQSHWSFCLQRARAKAEFTAVEAEHLWVCPGLELFEEQLLKQDPLAAPVSLHTSPSISALHWLLLCQLSPWPVPSDLAPAKEKGKSWIYLALLDHSNPANMWHQFAIASTNCATNALASDALGKMPVTHFTINL